MKAMCINGQWYSLTEGRAYDDPKYGEIVTVTDEIKFWNSLWYALEEYPARSFNADGFIPLSEIDETEMVREYNLEKV